MLKEFNDVIFSEYRPNFNWLSSRYLKNITRYAFYDGIILLVKKNSKFAPCPRLRVFCKILQRRQKRKLTEFNICILDQPSSCCFIRDRAGNHQIFCILFINPAAGVLSEIQQETFKFSVF